MARSYLDAVYSRWLDTIAEIGCFPCKDEGKGRVVGEIHHLRHGMGIAQRSPHSKAICLCPRHHRGVCLTHKDINVAVHGGARSWKWDEREVLERTYNEAINVYRKMDWDLPEWARRTGHPDM